MLLSNKTKKDIELEKIREQLNYHRNLEKKLVKLFESEEIDVEELSKIINDISNSNTSSSNSNNKKLDLKDKKIVYEKPINPELLKSYYEICNYLKNISDKNHLNIIKIVKFLEQFEKYNVKKYNVEKSEFFESKDNFKNLETLENLKKLDGKIVVLTTNDENIPITLKNGKKTILSTIDFDLSQFCNDELVEILRLLDVIIYDNRFDTLRKEIVKQITSISSISLV